MSHSTSRVAGPVAQTFEASIAHIVESNAAVREKLAHTLTVAGLTAITFTSPRSFLDSWIPGKHGCLLIDVDFPGFHGLEFQSDLEESAVTLPIILMSERPQFPPCVRHLKPGAVQLLVKPVCDIDLLGGVAVAFEKDLARAQAEVAIEALVARYNSLTAREIQVMELVSEGLMNKQIAAILNLSVITVKVHRSAMMRKMQWQRVAQAVRGADKLKACADRERPMGGRTYPKMSRSLSVTSAVRGSEHQGHISAHAIVACPGEQ